MDLLAFDVRYSCARREGEVEVQVARLTEWSEEERE